jgi:hypothetical protein
MSFPRSLTHDELRQLVDEQGVGVRELAHRWDVTYQSVESRLYRARRAAGVPVRSEFESQRYVPSRCALERALGHSLREFAWDSHRAALTLVREGLVQGRVARGWCRPYVKGLHSWVVQSHDPYSPVAWVIDVTLWCRDARFPPVYQRKNLELHSPLGYGHWSMATELPRYSGGPVIEPYQQLSRKAQEFLGHFAPDGRLDRGGWASVARLPVLGWPAKEIITVMIQTPRLRKLVPVDVAGMLTDVNPGRGFLREDVA